MSEPVKPEKRKKRDGPAKAPKHNPNAVTLRVAPENVEQAIAASLLRPEVSAAQTVRNFNAPAPDELTMDALIAELEAHSKAVNSGDLARGEAMLSAQAHTLDAIFGACIRRAQLNMGEYMNAAEMYFRVGLRAQSQCRATWETLAQMKNPAPVAFVRQANIANGPQQVNNGPAPEGVACGGSGIAPSKLLEAEHERMDTRAAARAGRGDPTLAPVGEIDGTAHGGGEGKGRE